MSTMRHQVFYVSFVSPLGSHVLVVRWIFTVPVAPQNVNDVFLYIYHILEYYVYIYETTYFSSSTRLWPNDLAFVECTTRDQEYR